MIISIVGSIKCQKILRNSLNYFANYLFPPPKNTQDQKIFSLVSWKTENSFKSSHFEKLEPTNVCDLCSQACT